MSQASDLRKVNLLKLIFSIYSLQSIKKYKFFCIVKNMLKKYTSENDKQQKQQKYY